jgi:hypothetical protein
MLTAAALLLCDPGSHLEAQSPVDAAIRACQLEALVRLRATHPQPSSVVFASSARARMYFNHAAEVRGIGLVQERSLLAWRRFSYQCAWRRQARQTVISVVVDSARVLSSIPYDGAR